MFEDIIKDKKPNFIDDDIWDFPGDDCWIDFVEYFSEAKDTQFETTEDFVKTIEDYLEDSIKYV